MDKKFINMAIETYILISILYLSLLAIMNTYSQTRGKIPDIIVFTSMLFGIRMIIEIIIKLYDI